MITGQRPLQLLRRQAESVFDKMLRGGAEISGEVRVALSQKGKKALFADLSDVSTKAPGGKVLQLGANKIRHNPTVVT